MITSRTNQKLKKVRKLISSAKERKETGLFVIEGARLFAEAPRELIDSVYVSEDCRLDLSKYKDAEIVENSIFRELSDTVTPQGILAVVKQPEWDIRLEKGKTLLLDGIRDPGNMGTIIRTAEAAGVKAVYLSPDCVDLYNPKVIRSTMGSIFRVPVKTVDLLSMIRKMQEIGMDVYGTSLSAVKSYREVDCGEAGIIVGSEANGISPEVQKAATENIIIPMAGQIESLNAAVSAAIMMFCTR